MDCDTWVKVIHKLRTLKAIADDTYKEFDVTVSEVRTTPAAISANIPFYGLFVVSCRDVAVQQYTYIYTYSKLITNH